MASVRKEIPVKLSEVWEDLRKDVNLVLTKITPFFKSNLNQVEVKKVENYLKVLKCRIKRKWKTSAGRRAQFLEKYATLLERNLSFPINLFQDQPLSSAASSASYEPFTPNVKKPRNPAALNHGHPRVVEGVSASSTDVFYCVVCSEELGHPSPLLVPVNEYQAMCLFNVLTFDSPHSVAPAALAKCLINGYTCPSCETKISDVQTLVEEWDVIQHKIRTTATDFKNILSSPEIFVAGIRSSGAAPRPRLRAAFMKTDYRKSARELKNSSICPTCGEEGEHSHAKKSRNRANASVAQENPAEFETMTVSPCSSSHFPGVPVIEKTKNLSTRNKKKRKPVDDPVSQPSSAKRFKPQSLQNSKISKDSKKHSSLAPASAEIPAAVQSSERIQTSEVYFNTAQLKLLTRRYGAWKHLLQNENILDNPDESICKAWRDLTASVSKVGNSRTELECWHQLRVMSTWPMIGEKEKRAEEKKKQAEMRKKLKEAERKEREEKKKQMEEERKKRIEELKKKAEIRKKMVELARKVLREKHEIREANHHKCRHPGCRVFTFDPETVEAHYRGKHLGDLLPFPCNHPSCEKKFRRLNTLIKHRTEEHGVKPSFQCDECGRVYNNAYHLKTHIKLFHIKNPPKYTCQVCNQGFWSQTQFEQHGVTHGQKLKCPVTGCSHEFVTKQGVQHHQGKEHGDLFPQFVPEYESYMCTECGKVLKNKYLFKAHQQKHQGILPEKQKCPTAGCGYTCMRPQALKYHIVNIHEATEPTIPCDYPGCDKLFKMMTAKQNHYYKCHKKYEREAKPKQKRSCPTCGMEVTNLKQHILHRHTADNKNDYPCTRCGKGFPTKSYLARHQRSNPNCKPPKEPGPNAVRCEICGSYVANMTGLKRHMHLKHNPEIRPWVCGDCGKDYPIKMYLTRHICPNMKKNKQENEADVVGSSEGADIDQSRTQHNYDATETWSSFLIPVAAEEEVV